MKKHEFNSNKFPVADTAIYHFKKQIFDYIKEDCFIAGGAISSYLSKEKINDIDIFFKSRKDIVKVLLKLRKENKFKPYMITSEAIKGVAEFNGNKRKIDLVKRIYRNPVECISSFDFTVCCFAVDRNNFYYHDTAPFDLLRKKLVINNLPYPVSSTRRMSKYLKRGYSICNGTIMELLTAVRDVPQEDFGISDFYPID